ncbi:43581_t:CDS:2, partial [Gigaspora margarita]
VDIYANYPKRPLMFKIQDFYAIVEYYLLYEFEESKVMLAYIQWTSSIEEDNIGYIEIDKSFYIVDKE